MLQTRRKISGTVSAQTFALLEEMITSRRVENVGEAVDLAIAALRREDHCNRGQHAAPYSDGPSAEEVAEDRAAVRVMHNSDPVLLLDE